MSLLDDVSIVVTPNAYKAGELYAVIPVPTEGAEEVIDGNFPTPNNNWNLTLFTIANNKLHCISDGTYSNAIQSNVFTVGKKYKITFDITGHTLGEIRVRPSGQSPFFTANANGSYTFYYIAAYSQIAIERNNAACNMFLENLSVKEYTSADMDVTRATAATRVDENGLVNYAEVVTGSDIVTNGDFATDSDWIKGTGWTISGGKANSLNSSDSFYQASSFISGKFYKVSFDITNLSSGRVSYRVNSTEDYITENGTHTITWLYDGSFNYIYFLGDNFTGSIDNVSVKEVIRDNVPRIDYTGGGCPHILAEPQRTNIIPYSEDLSQWNLVSGTITPNATVSPDGTQNADKVVFSSNGLDLKITVAVVAGQTYTISFYIKLESGTGLQGRFYDNSNGANIEYYDYTSQIQGTEWSRITRSVTAPSGCIEMQIWLLATSSSLVTASFWGAQFELGSYPTSYIPTSGSSVTRNQDIFTRDGIGSLINSTEGVLFAEIAALANDGTFRNISLNNGTTGQAVRIYYRNQANKITVLIGSSSGASVTIDVTDTLSFNKIAISYKVNDVRVFVNGSLEGTITSVTMPVGLNELALDIANVLPFFGKVKQLQVYDTALTDNQLIQLTGEAGTHFFESYAEMASALNYTIQ